MTSNTQIAPFPTALDEIVKRLEYRPGWRFKLESIVRDDATEEHGEASGLTFMVFTLGYDTYHVERGEHYGVAHYFPVPAATYNRESWTRWVLDQIIKVETHEACEFFRIRHEDPEGTDYVDVRPFAPNHGPGWDPYGIRELNYVKDAETTFRGERREGTQG
jgi:hypothetical protein